MNGWSIRVKIQKLFRAEDFKLFSPPPQRKCYIKTQYVKTHESESDLVGAKAEVGDR